MPKKFEADQDAVFSMAFLIKINQKKMKRLEKEYTTMKSKEKEDEIELRRMRTENRLLRQRIDMLETESSELADRLIQVREYLMFKNVEFLFSIVLKCAFVFIFLKQIEHLSSSLVK